MGFLEKKVENGGVVKKWTFPQCRVHYVQYQYFFYFTFYLFGGCTHPTHPPHRLPTGLVPEFTQSCCLTVLLMVDPVTAGTMTRQY